MKKERPLIRYEKLSKEDLVDYCRVYWRRIHNDEELFNEIYKDIESLKEENKKLKKELELVRKNTRANVETLDLMYGENVDLKKENKELQRENKKLKSDLAFERTMLDNVRAEYKSSQNVIKKLKEELKKYKKLHKYSNGELLTYSGD